MIRADSPILTKKGYDEMSKIISHGELAVGQFIMVANPRIVETPIPMPDGTITLLKQEDRTFMGVILKIEAVELPFIVIHAGVEMTPGVSASNIILDTRGRIFMEPKLEFVRAAYPKFFEEGGAQQQLPTPAPEKQFGFHR